MLTELLIRDLAIIDRLDLTFAPGFNVLTGETGAGKSIIIDAVNLLLGDRASADVVRAGAERTEVEGVFQLNPAVSPRLTPLLTEHGLEGDHLDLLVLAREVRANGRSVARVNGRGVTTALLGEIGGLLVDVHGQGEHLSLLRECEHVGLLDRYAGLNGEVAQVADLVRRVRGVRRELEGFGRTSVSAPAASTCWCIRWMRFARPVWRRMRLKRWRLNAAAWRTLNSLPS